MTTTDRVIAPTKTSYGYVRYYLGLTAAPDAPPVEVTQDEFVAAEQRAGFRPKPGLGPVATGGFSGGGVQGSVRSVSLD